MCVILCYHFLQSVPHSILLNVKVKFKVDWTCFLFHATHNAFFLPVFPFCQVLLFLSEIFLKNDSFWKYLLRYSWAETFSFVLRKNIFCAKSVWTLPQRYLKKIISLFKKSNFTFSEFAIVLKFKYSCRRFKEKYSCFIKFSNLYHENQFIVPGITANCYQVFKY